MPFLALPSLIFLMWVLCSSPQSFFLNEKRFMVSFCPVAWMMHLPWTSLAWQELFHWVGCLQVVKIRWFSKQCGYLLCWQARFAFCWGYWLFGKHLCCNVLVNFCSHIFCTVSWSCSCNSFMYLKGICLGGLAISLSMCGFQACQFLPATFDNVSVVGWQYWINYLGFVWWRFLWTFSHIWFCWISNLICHVLLGVIPTVGCNLFLLVGGCVGVQWMNA